MRLPFFFICTLTILTACGGGSSNKTDVDVDSDGDGIKNSLDAFPNDKSESLDTDSDGIGNNSDPDDDNDLYPDTLEISAPSSLANFLIFGLAKLFPKAGTLGAGC